MRVKSHVMTITSKRIRHFLLVANADVTCEQPFKLYNQGGHGTGKTGNLVITFSRQGKHREFCFDTGKNFETQGKYFSVTQGKIKT